MLTKKQKQIQNSINGTPVAQKNRVIKLKKLSPLL